MDFVLANSEDADEMSHFGSSLFAKVPLQGFTV